MGALALDLCLLSERLGDQEGEIRSATLQMIAAPGQEVRIGSRITVTEIDSLPHG
jgi:hypothetical protein